MDLSRPTPDEIRRVLCDAEIWERETDDASPQAFPGLPDSVSCIGGYTGEAIIGLAMTHHTPDGLKFHFAVLRPYRWLARAFLARVLEVVGPVYCDIPDCYRAVINFAKHAGFVETGKSGAYVKNGISYPRTRLCRS